MLQTAITDLEETKLEEKEKSEEDILPHSCLGIEEERKSNKEMTSILEQQLPNGSTPKKSFWSRFTSFMFRAKGKTVVAAGISDSIAHVKGFRFSTQPRASVTKHINV